MSQSINSMASTVAQRALGAQNTAGAVDLAKEAIKASIRDWNATKDWNFLLKDTLAGFSVAGCTCTFGSAVVNAPATATFDAVNIGVTVTVTGSGDTATLPADTRVKSYTRNADGTVAAITMGNDAGDNVTFGGTTDTSTTLTFSGDIPIRDGVNEYNLPTDFSSAYSVRLLTNKRLLVFIRYREWNKKIIDQGTKGAVEAYTVYNPVSPQTQNFGTYRMRVFRTPSAADTAHMQYFRRMDPNAATVDIPDDYIEMFIDYAIWRFIRIKNTEDTRLPHLFEVALGSLQRAMSDDTGNTEDEEIRLISQMEAWSGEKMLWSNGAFLPFSY